MFFVLSVADCWLMYNHCGPGATHTTVVKQTVQHTTVLISATVWKNGGEGPEKAYCKQSNTGQQEDLEQGYNQTSRIRVIGKQKLKKCPKSVPLTLSFRWKKLADLLGQRNGES